MERCKNCGAYLDPGEICDCVRSQEERAAMKEAMELSLDYLNMLGDIAEKYDYELKELIKKAIDALEEFVDEV